MAEQCDRILHFNATEHPSAAWVVQQIREAFPYDTAPKYLVFDRDSVFSIEVVAAIRAMGIDVVRTAFRSPWQNPVCERWIGSARRELLDRVIVFDERHLPRLLREYVGYHHANRTHLSLGKDTPYGRAVDHRPSLGTKVVPLPRVGGLHHRYIWQQAA